MSSSTVGLRMLLVFVVMSVIPAPTNADPIINFTDTARNDLRVPPGHELDPDDWAILDAIADRGWHLGWFKRKPRGDGDEPDPFEPPSLPWEPPVIPSPVTEGPASSPPGSYLPPPFDTGSGEASSPADLSVPEPASLLLLGSGLVAIAYRSRRATPRRR